MNDEYEEYLIAKQDSAIVNHKETLTDLEALEKLTDAYAREWSAYKDALEEYRRIKNKLLIKNK